MTKSRRKPSWQAEGLSRAERVIRFVESLKVTRGMHAGRRFKLRPWQREIIEAWYATDRHGKPIVRTGLLTMGRKNGKTALISCLALAHLVGPEQTPRGQVVAAAAGREQSAIIFRDMEAFLAQPQFSHLRMRIQEYTKRIEDMHSGSTFVALSREAKLAHGLSPSVAILDELGQWGDPGRGRALYDSVTTGTGEHESPLTIIISTQAPNDESIMSQIVDDGQKVLDGVVDDPSFSPFIYSVPIDADPFDESLWKLANPALGDFRSLEEMQTFAQKAKRLPGDLAAFQAYYLNQRVATTEQWLPQEAWAACAGEIDPEALRGEPCWGGLDLGSVRDLAAFALFFPRGGELLVWTWSPSDALTEREISDRVPYTIWRDAGYLETTPGKAIDKRVVAQRLAEICDTFTVESIGFDPWGMSELTHILQVEGITLPLQKWSQGYASMGPATQAFEARVLNGRMNHGSNPLLTWCVSNAAFQEDNLGNRRLTKRRSTARIDAAVAAVIAVGVASRGDTGSSIYDSYAAGRATGIGVL